MEIDFVVTYPCSIALRTQDAPYTFNAEGIHCVGLFTDDDVLMRFFESLAASNVPIRAKIEHATALCEVLLRFEGMPAGQTGEVAGVIIDPSPSKKARVYPIRDFVAHVKSSG